MWPLAGSLSAQKIINAVTRERTCGVALDDFRAKDEFLLDEIAIEISRVWNIDKRFSYGTDGNDNKMCSWEEWKRRADIGTSCGGR